MQANAARPDFEPEGSLPSSPGSARARACAPAELDLPVVAAANPYDRQIEHLNRQIGAVFPRQAMKDASGASQMDAETQITSLHGTSMLDAAQFPVESNICLSLLRGPGSENDRRLINAAVGAEINLFGTPALAAAQAARRGGNAPNTVLAAACGILGPRYAQQARQAVRALVEGFTAAGLRSAVDEEFDLSLVQFDGTASLFVSDRPDAKAEALLHGLQTRAWSVFVRYLRTLNGHPTADAVLAAAAATLAWEPLMRKRISLLTVETLPWWLRLFGVLIGASADAGQHQEDSFCGIPKEEIVGSRSLTEIAFAALVGTEPAPASLFAFQTLVGLLLSNGPGTISAQGAKGGLGRRARDARAGAAQQGADRLPDPFRLCPWRQRLRGHRLPDRAVPGRRSGRSGDPDHGIDLSALARRYAAEYATYKADKKTTGSLDIRKIPGVNHPVFKDKPVNHDPREVFVRELFGRREEQRLP